MESDQKRFLVAVDGSNQSLEAVRYICRLFPSENLEITLFHVLSKIPEFFYDIGKNSQYHQAIVDIRGWERALQDSINEFMSEAREALIDSGLPEKTVTIYIHERREGISRDIIAESHKGYSGMVFGRSGLSKFKDFIIGSVANKLMDTVRHLPISAVGGKPNSEKVLLALDESEGAMRAVEFVAGLMDPSKFEVMLLHVVRDFNIYEKRYGNLFSLNFEEEWRETGKSEMESLFKVYRTHLINSGFDPKRIITKIITRESTRAGAIIHEAGAGGYGTIVMGRWGVSVARSFT